MYLYLPCEIDPMRSSVKVKGQACDATLPRCVPSLDLHQQIAGLQAQLARSSQASQVCVCALVCLSVCLCVQAQLAQSSQAFKVCLCVCMCLQAQVARLSQASGWRCVLESYHKIFQNIASR